MNVMLFQCRHSPCYPGVECVNLNPGYRCGPCPLGYSGPGADGRGADYARRHRQICWDINECDGPLNGGCVQHSQCINTEVRQEKILTCTSSVHW